MKAPENTTVKTMNIPRFTAVIHVESSKQAVEQAAVAFDNGANGIFLIDHCRSWHELVVSYAAVRNSFTGYWIGLNFLDLEPAEAGAVLPNGADALWVDRPSRTLDCNKPIFAGTAFKGQGHVVDVAAAARSAAKFYEVVCTSGPGTGMAADLEKVRIMKEACGEAPLALASGVTPENAELYAPFVDCFMVATGISKSFHELDPKKVRALADAMLTAREKGAADER